MLKLDLRSRFVRIVDFPSGELSGKADFLSKVSKTYEESGLRDRAPLAIAILSVAFQQYPQWITSSIRVYFYSRPVLDLLAATLVISAAMVAFARTSRLGVGLFIAVAAIIIVPDWTVIANHSYLALWSIPVAVLFREWWKSDLYALYLRMTIGIIMLAAFTQKVLAGTYIDGSYIAYLSAHGSTTERMFAFLCDGTSPGPCIFQQGISIFILAWQFAVGILLLLGLNALLFLAVEISFLLGAGVFADEMNFQVLNIALLCVVFRFGMPLWLLAVSLALLVVDLYGVGHIVRTVVSYVA
jgi:hypothetical protein